MTKRRSNGEGYYKKLPSGKWLGQIMDGYNESGKKKVVSFTAETKAAVQQKIRQYLTEKESDKPTVSRATPFSQWADSWYIDYKSQVQPSTYSGYQYTLKLLKEYFGNRPLGEIKPIDINELMNQLVDVECSRSKINKCRAMLIQIFDAAESNELVQRNPARHSKIIREKDRVTQEKGAFQENEVQVLLKDLPHDLMGNSIRTLLGSGLRVQELLALRPDDIAEDGSSIKVNKAVKMVDGKPTLGPPKSKRSERIVPIPKDFRAYVMYIREHGGKAFIWTSGRDNLLSSIGTFRKRYYRCIASLPLVRKLTPHCCRHTYVTTLQQKGVSMVEIARLVGHSSIATTDGYLHVSNNTLVTAVSVLNKEEVYD